MANVRNVLLAKGKSICFQCSKVLGKCFNIIVANVVRSVFGLVDRVRMCANSPVGARGYRVIRDLFVSFGLPPKRCSMQSRILARCGSAMR